MKTTRKGPPKTKKLKNDASVLFVYDAQTRVVSDTTSDDDPYEGYLEEELDVDPRYLSLVGSTEFASGMDATPTRDDLSNADQAWVVYVLYTDGGTFGSSGDVEAIRVFLDYDEASECANAIQNNPTTWTDPLGNGYTYRPWDGYFASLGSVECRNLRIVR